MRVARLLVGVAAAILIGGCGGGTSGVTGNNGGNNGGNNNGNGSTSSSISVIDDAYSPNATTVPVGTQVTWTWNGNAQHSVSFDDVAPSPTQVTGTFSRTFTAAGTFKYHCAVHGTAMSGTVTVK